MKRLTDRRFIGLNGSFLGVSYEEIKKIARTKQPSVKELYERLGEYENAIEDGNLLKPPCTIGTPLFELVTYYTDINNWRVQEGYCSMLQQKADKSWKVRFSYGCGSCHDVTEDKFGKTIFTDRLQAEAKLKELKERR